MSQVEYAPDAVRVDVADEPNYPALEALIVERDIAPQQYIVEEFEKSQKGEPFDASGLAGMSNMAVGAEMVRHGFPAILASLVLGEATGMAYAYDGTTLTIVHEFDGREPLVTPFVRPDSELGKQILAEEASA